MEVEHLLDWDTVGVQIVEPLHPVVLLGSSPWAAKRDTSLVAQVPALADLSSPSIHQVERVAS